MAESQELPGEEDTRFGHLLVRVQAGSDGAARLLIEAYGPHILRIVRRRLNRRMRPKYDSLDFVQAVWTSFFARRQEIGRFTKPEEMIAYLGAVAANKVIDETRNQLNTRRYNVSKEESLQTDLPRHEAALAARQPTPSEAVVVQDLWDCLLEGQPSHFRRILELRRQGLSYPEIGQQLGLSVKAIQRVIDRLLSRRMPWSTLN